MRNKSNDKKIVIIAIIVSVIFLGALGTLVYNNIQNSDYENFIYEGQNCVKNNDTQKAISFFEEALEIDDSSGLLISELAKLYQKNNESEKAISLLKKYSDVDDANEFIYIVECANDIDSNVAFEMLKNYNKTNNSNSKLIDMESSATAKPTKPSTNVNEGIYIKDISVELKQNSENKSFGHNIRYTTDGTEPNENSTIYTEKLTFKMDTLLKAKAFNVNNEASETLSIQYKIDTGLRQKLNDLLYEAREKFNNTAAGEQIGNCSVEARKMLNDTLYRVSEAWEQENILVSEAQKAYDDLSNKYNLFLNSIIQPTNKSGLQSAIANAQTTVNTISSSDVASKVYSNITDVQNEINIASSINTNNRAKQEEINNEVVRLNSKVNSLNKAYENAKNPPLTSLVPSGYIYPSGAYGTSISFSVNMYTSYSPSGEVGVIYVNDNFNNYIDLVETNHPNIYIARGGILSGAKIGFTEYSMIVDSGSYKGTYSKTETYMAP